MKLNHIALTAGVLLLAGGATAYQAGVNHAVKTAPAKETTDVTLVNPSFESTAGIGDAVSEGSEGLRGYAVNSIEGWTLTDTKMSDLKKLYVTKDCASDNGFGQITSIPDGTYALYLRRGWNTGTTTLTQEIDNLPAGEYTLKFNWRSGYANSATSALTVIADGSESPAKQFKQGSGNFFTSEPWLEFSMNFKHFTAGPATVTLSIDWQSGGSCAMFDNFSLTRVGDAGNPDDPEVIDSPTEGKITHEFVAEPQMKDHLLQMLADFTPYMKNNWQSISDNNSAGAPLGVFKGENTMGNNEQGVRHNADFSMICAFLVKYAQGKVTLPAGISWDNLKDWAARSLNYAYSTHKANKLYACKNNSYWGSTRNGDSQWESSLWAMSVAYSAFFQWNTLTAEQKSAIEKLLEAECNYELERSIPTGYNGDTKAEENGWEVDVLAVALGLFPENAKAQQWFERMREFAINSYSHPDDASDNTVIDPDYDDKTVADLYKGQNLYDDWTLQNHNLFHTSYQNVVMQELGEAALGLKLFQKELTGSEKWKSNALMHNNQKVMDNVLNRLALADGELAMPNGNDWSLFLFDQITSYSTMACFLQDPVALFLENMAYKYIQARQKTTEDGSWLLRADVGSRRMGVEAHRVMMTWLMHEAMPTKDVTPATWQDIMDNYGETYIFPAQNVVRTSSPSRFVCFSWSAGLKNYSGYIASHNPDNNKIIVPFRSGNNGNFLGWYEVSGKNADATPVVSGIYETGKHHFVMNGELNTNGGALNNRFVIYATPGNAVIYLDYVTANNAATISQEKGGLMAISTDPFMKEKRTLYYEGNDKGNVSTGKTFVNIPSDWVNIDGQLGFTAPGNKGMGFGDQSNNNSILTSKLYTLYSDQSRDAKAGDVVDRRNVNYYTNVDAAATKEMRGKTISLTDKLPKGWNGTIVPDPDGVYYLLVSNFMSMVPAKLTGISIDAKAPVFSVNTRITDNASSATVIEQLNNSLANELRVFVKGTSLTAVQDAEDPSVAYITNDASTAASPEVTIIADGTPVSGNVTILAGEAIKVYLLNGALKSEKAPFPAPSVDDLTQGYTDVTAQVLGNPSFEQDESYSTSGSETVGSGTYDDCYINTVAPVDSKFANILPVKDWTNDNTLEGDGSPYCRMYSMPYSVSKYCVSKVGNYAAKCAPLLGQEGTGNRCLTVLNSWAKGGNRIYQDIDLEPGEYRVLIDMKMECPNMGSNDGRVVKCGNTTNTSLTGVKVGDTADYRYVAEQNQWQTLAYDFALTEAKPVQVSLGFSIDGSVGAANNTLLYLDNVRVLKKNTTGISGSVATPGSADVYTLDGILARRAADTTPLPAGTYVTKGRTFIVR